MKYYTKKPRYSPYNNKRRKIRYSLVVIIAIILIVNSFLYYFNKRILPAVISVAEVTMKSEAVKIINEESVKVYSTSFKYDDIVKIDKDSEGNIALIRSDTVKQNELAAELVMNCDKRLQELGELGVKIPMGYISNNSFFYQLGPNIKVKMKQIGNINTSYESSFEGAGLNQTRHKIYLTVDAKIRLILPLNSKDIDIQCQIPVSETIIVGKIPNGVIANTQ